MPNSEVKTDVKVEGQHETIFLTQEEKDAMMAIATEAEKTSKNGPEAAMLYLLQIDRLKKQLGKWAQLKKASIIVSPVNDKPGFFTVYVGPKSLKVQINTTETPETETDVPKEPIISKETENVIKILEEKFDPENMEKLAIFLTNFNLYKELKLLEKVIGNSKKEKGKTKETGAKATKIAPLSTPDNDVVDMLKKILTLMQKSYDEDKLQAEKTKNFEEEGKEEKDRKDKELLDALKEAKDKKDNPTAKEEKEDEESFVDKLLGAFGLGSAAKTALSVLGRVAGFFMGPVGGAILLATSLGALMLAASKESHAEASKVQGAADLSTEGKAITEAADDEVASKRATLLRQAHKEGAIKASWYEVGKQGKEEEDYLKSVGFDAKTGTTKERESSSPANAPIPTTTPTPPAAPTPPPAVAAPEANANIGQKLNQTTKENVFGKLDEKISQVAGAVVNNTATNTASKQQSPTGKIPPVRNQEETFIRMIYNNTRVV